MTENQKKAVSFIAHRGWSTHFPENSIPAFAAAIEAGADEIEFDVRPSSDGVPMVCHDSTVDRVSDLSGKFRGFSSAELNTANIKHGDSLLYGLGFATLEDIIGAFLAKVNMNIHIKELDDDLNALHFLGEIKLPPDHEFYIAGSPDILKHALEICPHIPRCLIQARKDTDIDIILENAHSLQCERIQFFKGYYTDADLQKALEHAFIANLFWEDEPEDAQRAIDKGVTGLLTNDIGLILYYLDN